MSEVTRYVNAGIGYATQSVDGGYVSYEDYAELKAQRDALAAENAVLKTAAKSAVQHWAAADQESMVRLMDKVMPACRDAVNATPATDAYLNSVRAESLESLAHQQRVIADGLTGEAQRSHRLAAGFAEDSAAKLRSGEQS